MTVWNLIDKVRYILLSIGHMLEPAVVLTTSTAHSSRSATLIPKWIPEMDSACKTTPKTNLNRKFLITFIFGQISIAPYSVTKRTQV